ncbi:striatin-interacting protein 1 homolog, partial [Neopelma chrysocephalum]|uniref:striatin-interacting protein 1 homolog n=1 Tax=Neopelma chrysocephalum TaxID=114329 RepID=UPI000FCD1F75
MKLGVDVNRHKEIIVKAISAVLLLLLKHFKLNHIYQFEYMAQHLVFANCIPLILKFFNQNIMSYITAKNRWGVDAPLHPWGLWERGPASSPLWSPSLGTGTVGSAHHGQSP